LRSRATYVQMAYVSAVSPEAAYTAEQQIADLLRQRHKLAPNQPDDFVVRNMTDVAEAADETTRIMTLLLSSIASVSLLVGGGRHLLQTLPGAQDGEPRTRLRRCASSSAQGRIAAD